LRAKLNYFFMNEENFTKSLNKEFDKVDKAIQSQPRETILILQAHLFAENFIDEIICTLLKRGDILMENNFTFFQKLSIIQALDIMEPHLIDVLKRLNKCRNNISHKLQYKLTERDVDLIGLPFGERYTKFKKENDDINVRLRFVVYGLIAQLHICLNKQQKK